MLTDVGIVRWVREGEHGVDGLRAVSDPEAENHLRSLLDRDIYRELTR